MTSSLSPQQRYQQLHQALVANGLPRVYGDHLEITVEASDAVKVLIDLRARVRIVGKFPSVGNGVQIVVTGIAFILFLFVLGSFGIIIAILIGQMASWFYFKPKIERLRQQVEDIVRENGF